jgi:hypothetical protein
MTNWYKIMLDVAKVTQQQRPKSREIFCYDRDSHSPKRYHILVYTGEFQHALEKGLLPHWGAAIV